METTHDAAFSGLVDLAAAWAGGRALSASDEFFAGKENLLKPGRGVFIADKFTSRGKWMDGWETRRRRAPGFDWCVIQLGLPGVLRGVDIDTNHFLGNHPPYASLEACAGESGGRAAWTEILAKSPLKPGSRNLFPVLSDRRWTHLRLKIYPDGGVARLRAYGVVAPDWERLRGKTVDLAALENGGRAVACNDMFFGAMDNLLRPGRAKNMGDGWETRRKRGPGHDWVIVRLGRPGRLERVEVDTNHFKGNFPDRCSLDGCHSPGPVDQLNAAEMTWRPILAEAKLRASARHFFSRELRARGPFTHVRLNIFPDGGVSRLRLFGRA